MSLNEGVEKSSPVMPVDSVPTKQKRTKREPTSDATVSSKPASKKRGDSDSKEIPSVKAQVRRMIISNFGCISEPITIDLDKIVVLVGPNNSGKSTILRAYHIVMLPEKEQCLTTHDFFQGETQSYRKPTIELHCHIEGGYNKGKQWNNPKDGTIWERWTWDGVGVEPKRIGFDFEKGDWSDERPYGADGLAKFHRPQPWRLKPFDDDTHKTVSKFILDHITTKIKTMPLRKHEGSGPGNLFESLASIVEQVNTEARQQVQKIVAKLTEKLSPIFPKHQVGFDPSFEPTDEKIRKFITDILNNSAELTFGLEGEGNYMGVLSRQGSGAQRMLMWAALRFEAEDLENFKNANSAERSHILLIDEPEICLHPSAIRDVARTLYQLAEKDNWQVMMSTHSPILLNLACDNTTIVRVERDPANSIRGMTIFRRDQPKLEPHEIDELKLLNLIDPYVTEFFFGGKTILVEGDTEYAAFKYVISQSASADRYSNLHIVRARGKSTLSLLAKIMTAFNQAFSVLHDADLEFIPAKRHGGMQRNSAFTENSKILKEITPAKASQRIFLIASLHNFEVAMFGEESPSRDDKPEHAVRLIRSDKTAFERVESLLNALIARDKALLPSSCIEWSTIDELRKAVAVHKPSPPSQTLLALEGGAVLAQCGR